MRGLSASLVANALTGVLLVAACAAPPDATTAAPVGTTPAVSGQGVPVALPSRVDSLLRHADSVYLRAPDSSTALFQIALDRAKPHWAGTGGATRRRLPCVARPERACARAEAATRHAR